MGRIRLHESRAILAPDQWGPAFFHALFSMAPDRFALGETSDVLITECSGLQREIDGVKAPGDARGVRWLLLEDVVRFFPIRDDDAWAFETDALKAQVVLEASEFEAAWAQWSKAQLVDRAYIDGLSLMRSLGLLSPQTLEDGKFAEWRGFAQELVSPISDTADQLKFSARLLRSCDRLFDMVREDSDCGSIFVSCPVEWINLELGENILESDVQLAELAHQLHGKYLSIPFDPSLACAPDVADFAAQLCARVPGAFPEYWTPEVISLFVRYAHRIKFGSVGPAEVIATVRAVDKPDDTRAMGLLAFLLGVSLGSNKAHSLARLLHRDRFKVATSSPEESVILKRSAGTSEQDVVEDAPFGRPAAQTSELGDPAQMTFSSPNDSLEGQTGVESDPIGQDFLDLIAAHLVDDEDAVIASSERLLALGEPVRLEIEEETAWEESAVDGYREFPVVTQRFKVLIADRLLYEGERLFGCSLEDPTHTGLGGRWVTIRIDDQTHRAAEMALESLGREIEWPSVPPAR
jgi:hypothetical protein